MEEAELQVFGNKDSVEMQKRNFHVFGRDEKCGSVTSHVCMKAERKCGISRKFRSLAVKAEWKCGSGTSHLWK